MAATKKIVTFERHLIDSGLMRQISAQAEFIGCVIDEENEVSLKPAAADSVVPPEFVAQLTMRLLFT